MPIHANKANLRFSWDQAIVADRLAEVRYRQGRLFGRMEGLGVQLCAEATLTTLTQDVINTSELEGETLDPKQVCSAIASRLGMEMDAVSPIDRNAAGSVDVMLDAIRNYAAPLSQERLLTWHAALCPTVPSGLPARSVGGWHPAHHGAKPVVSGPVGREPVSDESLSADRLSKEMAEFIQWLNSDSNTDLVVQSAVAHFWFVTIHPFADGNGRIARALADLLLARAEKSAQRFYSLSSQIQREQSAYFAVLGECQTDNRTITPWIEWYLNCLQSAIGVSEGALETVLGKARFWEAHVGQAFNDRQRLIINRLLNDVDEKLTSSQWARLTHCSQDTAVRDINHLLNTRLLAKEAAGGRSTRYRLRLPE